MKHLMENPKLTNVVGQFLGDVWKWGKGVKEGCGLNFLGKLGTE